jgi:hypothetical protein
MEELDRDMSAIQLGKEKGVMDVKARFAGCREEGKFAGCNPKQMEEHVEKRKRIPVVRL